MRAKLDRAFGLVALSTVILFWGLLVSEGDVEGLIFDVGALLGAERAFFFVALGVSALVLPLSAATAVSSFRFQGRRSLFALAWSHVLVVVFLAVKVVVLDEQGPLYLLGWLNVAFALGLGLVLSARWFLSERRRFGRTDQNPANEAGYSDPFWPLPGPVARVQHDLVHGCLAWATFGCDALLYATSDMPLAIFAIALLPATMTLATITACILALRLRFRPGLTVLVLFALAKNHSQIPDLVGALDFLSDSSSVPVASEGQASGLLGRLLAAAQLGAPVFGLLLALDWVVRARLRIDTFELARDREAWASYTAALPAAEGTPRAGARGPGLATRATFGISVTATAAAMIAFAVWTGDWFMLLGAEFLAYARDAGSGFGQIAPILFAQLFVASYVLLLIAPPLFAFPFALLGAWLWKRPRSLLLLRRFNRGAEGRALARLARRNLARVGHVYSLADRDMHVPWYLTLSTMLGQLSLLNYGYREITAPRQLARLLRALIRPWWRSVNWAVSWSKVFPIATSTMAWTHVVDALVRHVHVVVIDLSDWSDNLALELDRCAAPEILGRTLCVAREANAEAARARLRERERWQSFVLHSYDDQGEAPSLRAALGALLHGPER